MRFVVFGAGAIGGVIGGRLFQHGHDVVLVARGEHARAMQDRGLQLADPDGSVTLAIPVATHPGELDLGSDDVVVLAMKTQDTQAALEALNTTAGRPGALICAQNGVANERMALRHHDRVYALCVMCPATHLEPGVVSASSTPVSGILDLGRYPVRGVVDVPADPRADQIAAALRASTFESVVRPDIMRWKYSKLLMNLGNVVQAGFASSAAATELSRRARDEGRACLAWAGVEVASAQEDRDRRADLLTLRPVGDRPRAGGSTWQSLARGAARLETDYLNGEIVLAGRRHGFPTPVNRALQELGHQLVRDRSTPGRGDAGPFLDALDATGTA
jgi:2-dehydropantoate 2-reductase